MARTAFDMAEEVELVANVSVLTLFDFVYSFPMNILINSGAPESEAALEAVPSDLVAYLSNENCAALSATTIVFCES